MTDGHDPVRLSLGAYLLGAVDPLDRADVEAHLADCPACREELAALAGLPGLLGRVTADEVAGGTLLDDVTAEAGHAVLDRALTDVARAKRRQRRRWLSVAAAAVLIAAGATAAGSIAVVGSRPPETHSAAGAGGRTITATDPTTHVRARVTLRGEPTGTAITLSLAGVNPGQRCQLVAVAADGQHEVASSWRASYEGLATVTGTTAIPPTSLRSLQVVTDKGTPLVSVPAHR